MLKVGAKSFRNCVRGLLSSLSEIAFPTPFMGPFRAAHGATLLSELQVQTHCFNPLRTWQYQVSLSHRDAKKRM